MKLAAEILLLVFMLASVAVVFAFFIWGARKDGEADQAVQKRRRTR
jgi:cbb3-type cytochrome oxidase subunit 3